MQTVVSRMRMHVGYASRPSVIVNRMLQPSLSVAPSVILCLFLLFECLVAYFSHHCGLADSQLYKRLCPSVHLSVQSEGQSVPTRPSMPTRPRRYIVTQRYVFKFEFSETITTHAPTSPPTSPASFALITIDGNTTTTTTTTTTTNLTSEMTTPYSTEPSYISTEAPTGLPSTSSGNPWWFGLTLCFIYLPQVFILFGNSQRPFIEKYLCHKFQSNKHDKDDEEEEKRHKLNWVGAKRCCCLCC